LEADPLAGIEGTHQRLDFADQQTAQHGAPNVPDATQHGGGECLETGKKANATTAIKLADFIGQNVKLVAMGSEKKEGGKTVVKVKTLKTIEKATAPAADAAPAKVA